MREIKFGADGWRAEIGRDYTFSNVRILSRAVADYLLEGKKTKNLRVVVGYDSRFLSKEFAHEAALVFAACGIKVILSSEKVSTPVVSFTVKEKKMDLGI